MNALRVLLTAAACLSGLTLAGFLAVLAWLAAGITGELDLLFLSAGVVVVLLTATGTVSGFCARRRRQPAAVLMLTVAFASPLTSLGAALLSMLLDPVVFPVLVPHLGSTAPTLLRIGGLSLVLTAPLFIGASILCSLTSDAELALNADHVLPSDVHSTLPV